MKKGITLSHTQKEMYLRSPQSWFLHYRKYLRPETIGSALFFGSKLEFGIDALLEGKSLEDAKNLFLINFNFVEVNGKQEELSTSNKVEYSKSDLDETLIVEDYEKDQIQFYSWYSLKEKGLLLLEAYSKEVIPKIKKVLAKQASFEIVNEENDKIIGFADLICELNDGRTVLIDHKTSSIKYPNNATQTEAYGKQTALYYEYFKDKYKLDGVGFLVLEKKIRKKEPKVRLYFTSLEIPEDNLIDKTFEEFDTVCESIKNEDFKCNSPACDVYGKKCCYKKYCQSGGKNMTGLVKLEKRK